MRNKKIAVVVVLVSLVSAAAARSNKDHKGATTLPTANHAPVAATTDPAYVIGPQDVLAISVWKEPDLSETALPVRPDGKISLPLINDIQASGTTPMQLTAEIRDRLKSFVNDPRVTVIVTAINSQRVYVLGEVPRPGAYPLLPNMTVLQALSSCGGFTEYANSKKVYVLRTENGAQRKYRFNYKQVVKGEHIAQNIALRAGDTIVVP